MKKYVSIIICILVLAACDTSIPLHENLEGVELYTPEEINTQTISTMTPIKTKEYFQYEAVDDGSESTDKMNRNEFTARKFYDDWERIYNKRSACIDFDIDNRMWTRFINLEYLDGKTWNVVDLPDKFNIIRSCPHVAPDGKIYFYSDSFHLPENIAVFDQNNWSFIEFPNLDEQNFDSNTSLVKDDQGDFWLGLSNCESQKTCLLQYHNKQWNEIDFPFHSILAIEKDKVGNIWVGGDDDDGIAFYDGHDWTYFSTEYLWGYNATQEDIITDLRFAASTDDSIWVIAGSKSDWIRINSNGEIERYKSPFELGVWDSKYFYEDDQNRLWFILFNKVVGYFNYKTNNWINYIELPSDNLQAGPSLNEDHDGNLWLVLPNNVYGEAGIYQYIVDNDSD